MLTAVTITTPRAECWWPGQTVAVLASGPSLTAEDCRYVVDRDCRVIAVNSAVHIWPHADVLYSSDREWWAAWKRRGGVFHGPKFSIGSRQGLADSIPGHADVVVLKHSGIDGIDTDPTCLRSGQNSGAAAINLAVHFGARRVLLLGFNMGRVRGQHHASPVDRDSYSPFPTFIAAMRTQRDPLKALDVEVINCTQPTALDAFRVMLLRDALPIGGDS